jgi:hypothetical protein
MKTSQAGETNRPLLSPRPLSLVWKLQIMEMRTASIRSHQNLLRVQLVRRVANCRVPMISSFVGSYRIWGREAASYEDSSNYDEPSWRDESSTAEPPNYPHR